MRYEVWYNRHPTFRSSLRGEYSPTTLNDTHAKVAEIEARDMNDAYLAMQAENWSPNGERRPHIIACGVGHTSMSISDILVNVTTGTAFVCQEIGWLEIE